MTRLIFAFALLFVSAQAQVADPALDARAQSLERQMRCPVCQGQSLADSDAPLARDLRMLIRQRLAAGDSEDAIEDFLVARYGEGVLMTPAFRPATWVLWLGPGVFLLIGAGWVVFRRKGAP